MPASNPSPPPDASGTVRGLVNTVAQTFAGVKTFLARAVFTLGITSGSARLDLRSDLGGGASDVCSVVGTTVAPASVSDTAKLWSARAGLGGSETEYVYVSKGRKTLVATKGVGIFELADGASNISPGIVVRSTSGKAIALVAATGGAGIDFDITGPLSLFTENRSTIDSGDFAGSVFTVQQWSGDAATVLGFTSRLTSRGIAQPIQIIKMGANQTGAPLRIDDSADVPIATLAASGRLDQAGTDSTGSPGNATINKPTGKSAIAAGVATVRITNSLVTAASRVNITPHARDATCKELIAVPGAGFFDVSGTANATAALPFSWEVSTIL